MIINHKYKFIFVKTQKTAGTSLEIALSALCGSEDVITPISPIDQVEREKLGFPGPINYRLPFKFYSVKDYTKLLFKGIRKEYYNHMRCSEIKHYIGDDIFNSYYKFCVERNPYDKAISLFYHEGGYEKWSSILAFMEQGGLKIIKGYKQYTIDGNIAVDDIFKYENLNQALVTISDRLGLKEPIKLPEKKFKSQFRKDKRQYNEVLTLEEKQFIDTVWKNELELLNYKY